MPTAVELIKEVQEAGGDSQQIIARLREGIDGKEVSAAVIFDAFLHGLESTMEATIHLFTTIAGAVGLPVDREKLNSSYLEALQIAMDSIIYDRLHGEDDDPIHGEDDDQMTIDEAIAEAEGEA